MKDVEAAEINEDKIDRLLHLLHEADPTNSDRDTEEMLLLESTYILLRMFNFTFDIFIVCRRGKYNGSSY